MSNPLKYTTSTPTGALRHATLGAGVANGEYDSTWRSGITPYTLTSYYLVYEPDSGGEVRVYAPADAAELIQLAQSKGSSETTEAGALTWLSSNGFYPANKVLDNIVTDGLKLLLNSGAVTSYPTTGTNILDLCGDANDGILANGVTFDAETKTLVFDGVDDYISIPNPLSMQSNLDQEWTVMAWVNLTEKHEQILVYGMNRHLYVVAWQGNNSILYLNSGANDYYKYGGDLISPGRWSFVTFRFRNADGLITIYKNLTDVTTSGPNKTSTPDGISSTLRIGQLMEGNLGGILMYDRVLSNTELRQNYFQGPIVTDDLVGAFDAGNLVSFENSTTTTYSLTGSLDGTLYNGVGFSNTANGSWIFDGVDDEIDFGNPSELSNTQVTVTFWYNPTTLMNSTHCGIINGRTPGGRFCLFWINGTTLSTQYRDDSGLSRAAGGVWTRSQAPTSISTVNKWYFIQITGDESTDEWRVGIDLNVSTTDFGSQYVDPDSNQWLLGRRAYGSYDHSKIANLQIYDRILSQSEITQNYNANIKRFT